MQMTQDQFVAIVKTVESECEYIGCGTLRRQCRERAIDRLTRGWFNKNRSDSKASELQVMLGGMMKVVPDYLDGIYWESFSQKKLQKLRESAYDRLIEYVGEPAKVRK